jgi:tetratricopeptide (TPR) repeat protein
VLYNSLGRYEEALAAAQRASEDCPAMHFTSWALVELVEAAVRSAVPERAAGALQRLSGIARACGTDWALGTEARSRALVSDGAAAENLYREAIDRFGRTRLCVERGRAHLVYGEWLRRQRRRREARDQLASAHEIFDSIGAAAFAERALVELRATGGRRRLQPGDRRAAVHQPRHRRLPPAEGLHQARRQLAQPACSRSSRRASRSTAGHAAG